MSSGRTGTLVRCLPVAALMAATIAGVELMVGDSPIPLAPKGPQWSPSSMIRVSTSGCVEERWDQVVGERGIQDDAFFDHKLLHHGKTHTLHDPTLELAGDRLGVEGRPDVLCRVDANDSHETKLRIDVHDRPVRGDDESGVYITLAVLVRRERLWMTELHRGTQLAPPHRHRRWSRSVRY